MNKQLTILMIGLCCLAAASATATQRMVVAEMYTNTG